MIDWIRRISVTYWKSLALPSGHIKRIYLTINILFNKKINKYRTGLNYISLNKISTENIFFSYFVGQQSLKWFEPVYSVLGNSFSNLLVPFQNFEYYKI